MQSLLDRTTCARWIVLWLLAVGGLACGTSPSSPEPTPGSPDGTAVGNAASSATATEEASTAAVTLPGAQGAPAAEGPVGRVEPTAGPDEPRPEGQGAAPTSAAVPLDSAVRRTGSGLPDELRGYQTWFRLSAGSAASGVGGHLPQTQAYVDSPLYRMSAAGTEIPAPLAVGTRIVLESKAPTSDFIEEVSAMTKTDAGWEFSLFVRSSRQRAFEPVEASACGGCHGKATATDSVYSSLILR